jgi:hypothetical protein
MPGKRRRADGEREKERKRWKSVILSLRQEDKWVSTYLCPPAQQGLKLLILVSNPMYGQWWVVDFLLAKLDMPRVLFRSWKCRT